MIDYPDSDFPWTFYFNGEAMPRWGQCWMSCGMQRRASDEWDASGDPISAHFLWTLWCRIDHVGVIESEDVLRFRVSVRMILKVILQHQMELEKEAETWGARYGVR